jgi:hypothetical protein
LPQSPLELRLAKALDCVDTIPFPLPGLSGRCIVDVAPAFGSVAHVGSTR